MKVALKLHPDSRCTAASEIEVKVSRSAPGVLVLRYSATGEMRDLEAPPPGPITRADELWRHTCFEAFIQSSDGSSYCEFNLAPSRQWAAYQFDSYREGMRAIDDLPSPEIEIRRNQGAFGLKASLQLGGVAMLPTGAPWRLALTAVIETVDGDKSYWSLAHPQGKPDFHHADNFALTLAPESP